MCPPLSKNNFFLGLTLVKTEENMISHLHTSNDVQTWLTGKNSAQQDDEHDDEDSDDEVEEEEMDLQSVTGQNDGL